MSLDITVAIQIVSGDEDEGEQINVSAGKREAAFSDIRTLAALAAARAEHALGANDPLDQE